GELLPRLGPRVGGGNERDALVGGEGRRHERERAAESRDTNTNCSHGAGSILCGEMLTREQNELLCRVEGTAPMGGIMRRHWLPVCMSEEVAEKDGAPVKSRLVGEDLVVFRDSDGKLGVLDEHCPHRGASLVFGRNEEC